MSENKPQVLKVVEITAHANPALVGRFVVHLADGTTCVLSKEELVAYGVHTSEQADSAPIETGTIGEPEPSVEEAKPVEAPAKPSRKKK